MLNYKGYIGYVEFDDKAEIFAGEVINTKDVITFQSDSAHDLKQAFIDSIEDYLTNFRCLDDDLITKCKKFLRKEFETKVKKIFKQLHDLDGFKTIDSNKEIYQFQITIEKISTIMVY